MKIDTSSYYPESPLDEDPEDEIVVEESEVVLLPSESAPSSSSEEEKPVGNDSPEPDLPLSEGERIVNIVSTILSWVLVPLLMPVFGIILAFNYSLLDFTPMRSKIVFTLITAAFNVAIPMLLVLLLKRVGLVNDLGLNGRKERLIPYIISILCMGGTGLFMYFKGAPMWLVMFFIGGAVAALVNLLINFGWKISAHAAGAAGVVAMLVRIISDGFPQQGAFGWLIAAIALTGLLGSSRVWLGRHTVWQVLAGYAVGFTSVLLFTLIH